MLNWHMPIMKVAEAALSKGIQLVSGFLLYSNRTAIPICVVYALAEKACTCGGIHPGRVEPASPGHSGLEAH